MTTHGSLDSRAIDSDGSSAAPVKRPSFRRVSKKLLEKLTRCGPSFGGCASEEDHKYRCAYDRERYQRGDCPNHLVGDCNRRNSHYNTGDRSSHYSHIPRPRPTS